MCREGRAAEQWHSTGATGAAGDRTAWDATRPSTILLAIASLLLFLNCNPSLYGVQSASMMLGDPIAELAEIVERSRIALEGARRAGLEGFTYAPFLTSQEAERAWDDLLEDLDEELDFSSGDGVAMVAAGLDAKAASLALYLDPVPAGESFDHATGWLPPRLALAAEDYAKDPSRYERAQARLVQWAALKTKAYVFWHILWIAAALVLWFGPWSLRSSPTQPPSPSFGVAEAIAVLCFALGAHQLVSEVCRGLDAWAPGLRGPVWNLHGLAVTAASLAIVYRLLLRPAGIGLRRAFGFELSTDKSGSWLLGVTALCIGVELAVYEAVSRLSAVAGLRSSWTEHVVLSVAEWGELAVAVDVFDLVVFAPLREEVLFRGVLFGGLATRLGPWGAAFVSSLAFASIHGYGSLGFVSLCGTGMVFCWIYRRTGSLVPAVIAHALMNAEFAALTYL